MLASKTRAIFHALTAIAVCILTNSITWYSYYAAPGAAAVHLEVPMELYIKPLTQEVYDRWGYLTDLEKLPYLLDNYMMYNIKEEFSTLIKAPIIPGQVAHGDHDGRSAKSTADSSQDNVLSMGDGGGGVQFAQFVSRMGEFQAEKEIERFFEYCDGGTASSMKDGIVTFLEYAVCRCDFDSTGHPNAVSDISEIENIVLDDFYREEQKKLTRLLSSGRTDV